jgi:hypothetical protein
MLPCQRDSISSVAPLDEGAEEEVVAEQATVLEVLLQRTARLCVTAADAYDMESSLAEGSPHEKPVVRGSKDSMQPTSRCLLTQPHSGIASNVAVLQGPLHRKSELEAMSETMLDRRVYAGGISIATHIGHHMDRDQA